MNGRRLVVAFRGTEQVNVLRVFLYCSRLSTWGNPTLPSWVLGRPAHRHAGDSIGRRSVVLGHRMGKAFEEVAFIASKLC